MLTPLRGAVAAALVAATALLAPPATAEPGSVPPVEVVGGPDLASPGVVVHLGPGATPLPSIDAHTWLLADLTTGEVLAAKGAHTRALPASMLKTLTAITLMPRLDRNQVVTATDFDTHAVGGHVGIVAGATYTVWDLYMGLLLPSANDAANALTEANGGFAKTVDEMAAEAHHLQAYDTTPKTPSGLDTPGQLSSAYDMALIARAALAIPDFQTVTMTKSYDFPGKMPEPGKTRSTFKIFTENRLLRHHYEGTVGGKTGFTSLAHRTFWGAAERGGHTLVVTLFQIKEPTEQAARALLDWGFANLGRVTPVGTLVPPLPDATSSPSAAPSVAAGGSATASAPASAVRSSVPWALVLLVLGVAAAGLALVPRRRRRRPRLSLEPAPRAARRAPAPVRTGTADPLTDHAELRDGAPPPTPHADAETGPVPVVVAPAEPHDPSAPQGPGASNVRVVRPPTP